LSGLTGPLCGDAACTFNRLPVAPGIARGRSSATGRVLRAGSPLPVTPVSKRVIEPCLYCRQPCDRRSRAGLGLLHSERDACPIWVPARFKRDCRDSRGRLASPYRRPAIEEAPSKCVLRHEPSATKTLEPGEGIEPTSTANRAAALALSYPGEGALFTQANGECQPIRASERRGCAGNGSPVRQIDNQRHNSRSVVRLEFKS
jgi:hypothetical protein